MARLARGGIDIHHESHGEGPPILLTHGFGATGRMWDEQIEEFTDRFRMIPWDLPAHGQSGAPRDPGAYSPDAAVQHMRAILDRPTPAILIGLGVGGLLTLRFWRAYPELVRGMILIGTIPGLRSPLTRAVWNARTEALAVALERDGLDALEGGAEVDPRLHREAAALAMAARGLLKQDDEGALLFLADIDAPAMIVAGGDDKPSLSAATYMARTIPGARLEIVRRANHAVNIHKPDAANEAIRAFLGRLPARISVSSANRTRGAAESGSAGDP